MLFGKDVASVLGYSNPSKAVIVHVDQEDKRGILIMKTNLTNKKKLAEMIVNAVKEQLVPKKH